VLISPVQAPRRHRVYEYLRISLIAETDIEAPSRRELVRFGTIIRNRAVEGIVGYADQHREAGVFERWALESQQQNG
jgi:hypothetical protein